MISCSMKVIISVEHALFIMFYVCLGKKFLFISTIEKSNSTKNKTSLNKYKYKKNGVYFINDFSI